MCVFPVVNARFFGCPEISCSSLVGLMSRSFLWLCRHPRSQTWEMRRVLPSTRFNFYVVLFGVLLAAHPTTGFKADANLRLTHISPLQVAGPIETQLNVVFVSSGFLVAESIKFSQAARKAFTLITHAPPRVWRTSAFHRFARFHNVYGVFVPSLDRGAASLAASDRKDTALHCTFVPQADEYRGRLECDMEAAQQYAHTSPAASRAAPNTLVIALVETALLGASSDANRRCIALSTAYFSQRSDNETAAVLAHLVGHALFGLRDEYSYGQLAGAATPVETGMPNCYDTRSGAIPWAATIFQQRQNPLLAAIGDDGDDAELRLDGTPNSPCEFSNWLRPSATCLMRKRATLASEAEDEASAAAGVVRVAELVPDSVLSPAEAVHFCFVCQQHMARLLLRTLVASSAVFNPVSHAGRVAFTQWPRCPMPREIVLVRPDEMVHLHTNLHATLANGFSTRWAVGDFVFAENITTFSIQAARILEVGKQSSVTVSLRTTDLLTHDRMMTGTVAEEFSQLRVAETTYEVQVVDNPASFVGWSTRSCANDAMQAVSSTVYRSFCPNLVECTYNYSTSVIVDTDAGARILPLQMIALLATLGFIVTPWVLLARQYQTAKAYYRDPQLVYMRLGLSKGFILLRWLIIFANVLTVILALATWITALKLYVVTRQITTATLLLTLLVAFVTNSSAVVPMRGCVMRSFLNFIASAVISILSGITVIVLLFVVSDIAAKISDPGGQGTTALRDLWIEFVGNSPEGACSVQEQLSCSGWETNCVRSESGVGCPRNCAVNRELRTPCQVVVANVIAGRIVAVKVIMQIMATAYFVFALLGAAAARYAFVLRRDANDIQDDAKRADRAAFVAADAAADAVEKRKARTPSEEGGDGVASSANDVAQRPSHPPSNLPVLEPPHRLALDGHPFASIPRDRGGSGVRPGSPAASPTRSTFHLLLEHAGVSSPLLPANNDDVATAVLGHHRPRRGSELSPRSSAAVVAGILGDGKRAPPVTSREMQHDVVRTSAASRFAPPPPSRHGNDFVLARVPRGAQARAQEEP